MDYVVRHFQAGIYNLLEQINATTVIDLASELITNATNLSSDADVLINRIDSIMRQIDIFFIPIVLVIFVFCTIMSITFVLITMSLIQISKNVDTSASNDLHSVKSESSFNSDLRKAVNRRALYVDAYSNDSKAGLLV